MFSLCFVTTFQWLNLGKFNDSSFNCIVVFFRNRAFVKGTRQEDQKVSQEREQHPGFTVVTFWNEASELQRYLDTALLSVQRIQAFLSVVLLYLRALEPLPYSPDLNLISYTSWSCEARGGSLQNFRDSLSLACVQTSPYTGYLSPKPVSYVACRFVLNVFQWQEK